MKTKAILDFLIQQMEKLDKGQISIEQAKEQANLAKQTNNVLRYELDRAIAKSKYETLAIREIDNE